ncbi:hypothetical protein PFICI_00046 [Pestalotiopsis fici W106-1]|uniref:Uncharacterized protein n=1 Tax=Pestalotiopsis fici (strain W106-1 / CGMCC3.15140) TaxID=1229662 RepID=W3XJK1_PESFW|nr:uncharacterized protein PFICI_00046 [Pestalotiopsis fici W106-1]ETS86218.1 hypothetical protein PFICI_00046 [Pestalotiopsis fici W106-1]
MAHQNKTLLVIGAGPGIGRSITTLFASNGYTNVALFARSGNGLAGEQKAVEESIGSNGKVKTYQVDAADTEALAKALAEADADFGKPDCIFYNAARVRPSELLTHDLKEIEYDFKINVSGLYTVSQHYMPHLLDLAKKDPKAQPSLIVTSSCLPLQPVPQFFALSLVKAAQRNMVQSMNMTYTQQGVSVGLINVGGPVTADHPTRNPPNIADKSWAWFSQLREKPSFEVLIE